MATTKLHSIDVAQARKIMNNIVDERKTNGGMLIQSYACSRNPDEAKKDFLSVRNSIGTGRGKIFAQHIIQSFKPNEITPEKAFEVDSELCNKFLKFEYQFLFAVHTDVKNIHCHILFNNVNMENGKSFTYLEDRGKKSWITLRRISDEICQKHGLSVIENMRI